MQHSANSFARHFLLWLTLTWLGPLSAIAQTPTSSSNVGSNNEMTSSTVESTATIGALLAEVRLLRLVLQGVNVNTKRIQLATERIRLQQDRVDKYAHDLEETREKIAENKANQTKIQETVKELESLARKEQFPQRRLELERQISLTRLELGPYEVKLDRHKERENQLVGTLNFELAQLNELKEKLNIIEREFDAQAAADRLPVPTRKR